jgi:hypothetical protein
MATTTLTTAPTVANPTALRHFVSRDESRADIFSSPEKLKAAFADAAKKAYNRSPDSDWGVNGGNEALLYKDALAKIYNISDYTPPNWRNPD